MTIENTFGNINFNGVDLSDNNIFVQHYPLMGAPSRRQTVISGVAHRNAVFDEKEYDNVDVELDFVIVADTFDELSERRAFLFRTLDVGGYVPVKIDPDPFVYYMYRTSDMKETLFDGNPLNWIRVITVAFSRDPFKYYDVNVDRNYVLNSSGMSASATNRPAMRANGVGSANTSSTIAYNSDSITLTYNGNGTQEWYYALAEAYQKFSDTNIEPNKQYTISVDVKGTAPAVLFRGNSLQSKSFGINNDTWTRIAYTFNFVDYQPGFWLRLNASSTNGINGPFTSGQTLSFRNFKLESGNQATDWTPAPEDGIQITTSGTTISNPSNYESLPKITIYANTGTGTTNVNINGVIQLKNVNGNIVLDSMLEDAYWIDSSGNYVNGNSSMVKSYFPKLKPQLNSITFDSTVSKVVITPRWRTL